MSKTAKEMKEELAVITPASNSVTQFEPFYDPVTVEWFQAFCDQLCQEQREICARKAFETGIGVSHSKDIQNRIRNAPKPEVG